MYTNVKPLLVVCYRSRGFEN